MRSCSPKRFVQASGTPPLAPPPDAAVLFTTYYPFPVESHYSVQLCLLMLGELSALLRALIHTATVIGGLKGYPIFLPPRSMARRRAAPFSCARPRSAWKW